MGITELVLMFLYMAIGAAIAGATDDGRYDAFRGLVFCAFWPLLFVWAAFGALGEHYKW